MDMTIEEYEVFLNKLSALVVELEKHGVTLGEIVLTEPLSYNGRTASLIAGVKIISYANDRVEETNGEY